LILTRLELVNFRNYLQQEIDFAQGLNIITGRNAQGKSNLLEAVYFLSHFRSSRAPRLRELLGDEEQSAVVRGSVMDGNDRLNIRAVFGARGRSIDINGQKVTSSARARGIFKCVLFAPEDLYVVKGDPAKRRDYFDETMEELGPTPASTLQRYRHVLRQRNAVLRSWEEHADLAAELAPWDQGLIEAGVQIVSERLAMIEGIRGVASETYKAISGEGVSLGLEYKGTFDPVPSGTHEASDTMRTALERTAGEEKRVRTTVVGPHRDDIEISLGCRGARFSASQGEQRTIAFCLRVAQERYLRQRTGRSPVLLLDDVLSELDEHRRHMVLEIAGEEGQAIITATELPPSMEGRVERLLVVDGGKVEVG
jgi:DNA replication and repair protein RecF